MRNLIIALAVFVVLPYSFGTTRAQSKTHEVVANIEQAMKEMDEAWNCSSVTTPQGEPGPDSPRGTKYLFRCRQRTVVVTVFILYGESKRDAEKTLDWSQRLQVNDSTELAGIGDQAYQLSKERFAWITFRKANVFSYVTVSVLDGSISESTSEIELSTADSLFYAANLFARLVADCVPAS